VTSAEAAPGSAVPATCIGTTATNCAGDGRGTTSVRSAPACLSTGTSNPQHGAVPKVVPQSDEGAQHGIRIV
jgi:hypothetical protein